MKVVAVSGGFDPVTVGHVRMFAEAKKLGDKLIVIMNNDNWLMQKKKFVFMPQQERVEILRALRMVDEVMITFHEEGTTRTDVCNELESLRPDIFANGGDRKADNIPEYTLCLQMGCEMVFNVGGGKIQSSSELVKNACNALSK